MSIKNLLFNLILTTTLLFSSHCFPKPPNIVTLQQDWNTDNFPFDSQTLKLKVEDSQYDSRKVVLIPDTAETKYDQNTNIQGFKITSFKLTKATTNYQTTYGPFSFRRRV